MPRHRDFVRWDRLWRRWRNLGRRDFGRGLQVLSTEFHLEYFPLPGGDAAIKKPARTALAFALVAGVGMGRTA